MASEKLILTGHTRGIGKKLFNDLSPKFEVIPCSRSTNFDIDKDLISEMFLDSKIFINNAYSDNNGQSRQLLDLYNKNYRGHVINIGSISSERTDAKTVNQILYSANKKHLECVHHHVKRNNFKSSLIILGMVDTEYNKNKNDKKLSLQEVSNIIQYVIKNNIIGELRIVPFNE